MTQCEFCGQELAENPGRGRKRRYCSDACRMASSRARRKPGVPADMAMADRWVRWKRVTRGDGTTKLPVRMDGSPASSTDPATWATLIEAEASTVGDGLGFALGDGFACIDLDHCYDSRNHIADWAKMILAPVEGRTYIEISPSGDGLHIWGRAAERTGVRVRGLMNAEAYSRDRYVTYTGRVWHDSPGSLADLTFLFDVLQRLA